jgi:hypothetical protein
MPTTIDEHTYVPPPCGFLNLIKLSTSIDMYADRFVRAFPSLPSLASFIGMISASPRHVRNLLPSDIASDSPARQLYMDALIWLLKQDLVVQVHTRARVFARPEIKEAAWRKLWHRRRDRWLRSQAYEKSPDLRTRRALNGNGNPMDATVPPPKMDQSFMDFDPDLEMDSDMGEGDTGHLHDMDFSMNVVEPENVPEFGASFIFKPARAQKDEARWLRVIRESADAVWASKFDL